MFFIFLIYFIYWFIWHCCTLNKVWLLYPTVCHFLILIIILIIPILIIIIMHAAVVHGPVSPPGALRGGQASPGPQLPHRARPQWGAAGPERRQRGQDPPAGWVLVGTRRCGGLDSQVVYIRCWRGGLDSKVCVLNVDVVVLTPKLCTLDGEVVALTPRCVH